MITAARLRRQRLLNPIAAALIKRDAWAAIEQLRLDANIQALMGNNPQACIHAAGLRAVQGVVRKALEGVGA